MGRKVSKNLTNRSKRLTKKRSTKRIKSNVNTYRKNLKNKTKRRKYTKRRNTKRRNTKRRNKKKIKGGAELMGLSFGYKAGLAGVGLAAAVAIRRLNKKINKKIEECTDIKRELTTTQKELKKLREAPAVNQQKILELEGQLSEMGRQLDEKNMELKSLEKFKGKLSTKSTDGKEGVDEEEMEGLLSEDGEDDEDEAVKADEAGEDDETDEADEDVETGPDAGEDDADDVEEAKPCSKDTFMLNQMTSPEVADDLTTHLTNPCLRYIWSLEHAKDDYIAEHGPNFKMSGLFKDVYKFDVTELKIAEEEASGKVGRGAQAVDDVRQRQIETGKAPAGREVDHHGSSRPPPAQIWHVANSHEREQQEGDWDDYVYGALDDYDYPVDIIRKSRPNIYVIKFVMHIPEIIRSDEYIVDSVGKRVTSKAPLDTDTVVVSGDNLFERYR